MSGHVDPAERRDEKQYRGDRMMHGTTTHQKPQPVFKVKTNIKAGYYLGIALSAGQGTGASL